MMAKVGLDRATAERVIASLQEHATELPKLRGEADGAQGLLDQKKGLFKTR
jgi:hypothetical protein